MADTRDLRYRETPRLLAALPPNANSLVCTTRAFMALAVGTLFWLPAAAFSQEPESAPVEDKPPAASPLPNIPLQPGDEAPRRFRPKSSVSQDERNRAESLALFMNGRLQQERGEFDEALDSYRQAIEKNPKSMEPYKLALPLLLELRREGEARAMALSAAEHDASGFDLIRAMAAVLVKADKLPQATELLKEGLLLPTLTAGSQSALALHRDLGLFLRLQSDFAQASEHYKLVFEAVTSEDLDPKIGESILGDSGQTFDEFGEVFLKAEQPDLALRAFEEASKHRDAKPGLHSYNLATVFRQTGKPERALECLQEYFDAQLQTRGRAAYVLLEELLAELSRSDELLGRLEALAERDKRNDALRYFLADKHLDAGDSERAQALYTHGRATLTDPRALVGMFAIYHQQKDYAKLLPTMTKVFQTGLRPDDDAVMQQLAPDLQDLAQRFQKSLEALKADEEAFAGLMAYGRERAAEDDSRQQFFQTYLLGKLAIETERTADAVFFYKAAISMRNDPPGQLYSELGRYLLFTAEDYAAARDLMLEAVQHRSNALQREKVQFLYFLSYAHAFLDETDSALAAVREARQLSPGIPQLEFQEAWIAYHARNWDQALQLFQEFIDAHGKSNSDESKRLVMTSRFSISNIHVERGEITQGEAILEEVLDEDPDNVQANNDLGYLWADQNKNLERAEKMIRKALEAEPDNHAYLDSLGWVLYRRGEYEKAIEHLEKSTSQKRGEDSTVFDHLGDALNKLGKLEEAEKAWRRALDLELEKKRPSEKLVKALQEKLGLPATGVAPADEPAAPEETAAP